jgi:hypothetical protein
MTVDMRLERFVYLSLANDLLKLAMLRKYARQQRTLVVGQEKFFLLCSPLNGFS